MRKILMFMMVLPLLFAGCSKDDDDETMTPASDVELYYQQEETVSENSYSGTVISDGFIASYSGGKIKGLHVGKTTGRTSSNQTFNITVKSKVSAIKEISREWGASRESLINNSVIGTFKKSTNDDDVWGATSSDGKIIYMYSFTNGVLSSSSILVHVSLAGAVADYLKERFTLVNTFSIFGAASGYDSDNIDKAKTVVGVTAMDASHYVIAFIPKNK